ncbi:hypothetical protein FQZ97_935750 [compost metagenome]
MGHGAPGQAGARATRDHGHGQRMTGPEHGGHLVFGFGQGHHQRPLAVGGQAVALVGRRVLVVPEQRVSGQHRLQCTHHLGLARGAFEWADLGRGGGCVHGGAEGNEREFSLGQSAAPSIEETCSRL